MMKNKVPELGEDIQKKTPSTRVALSRVGVTSLKRILRLRSEKSTRKDDARSTLFFAEMDLFAHLDASQSGVHMSRFVENIENIAADLSTEPSPNIETLAERMALAIAQTQGAARSEVRIRAQYPMAKVTPASGTEVEDLYTFIGVAISDGTSTRRAVGVEVNGFTVCPCAREMVAEHSRNVLRKNGYSDKEAEKIASLLPLASHNQRGTGTLIVGTEMPLRAKTLVHIVESSMSSKIYELLKRPDELHVVTQGHANPRFVEDVVREIIRNVAETCTDLPEESFIVARQENFESIHSHNAYAERCGFFGDMLRELQGVPQEATGGRYRISSLEAWLDSLL
ncbi:GTP cyclohydrolase MptA [Synergistaceae bacterium OttesenSCG-928-I11]|nr:GTP cyclohydrolase MptA [Synergistaceae bacterium OttesenSCG-928-I11]